MNYARMPALMLVATMALGHSTQAQHRGSRGGEPSGACCQETGTCSIETLLDCANLGGFYLGDDSTCADASCFEAAGDDCDNPLIINIPADLSYSAINTTIGRSNAFSGSCMGNWDDNNDMVFQLNVTTATCITALLTSTSNLAGMAVVDDCQNPVASTCVGLATTSANPDVLLLDLLPGTYWLIIDAFAGTDDFLFLLDIFQCPVGPCCLPEGSCIETTLLDCFNLGGELVDALDCNSSDCDSVRNDTCQTATNLNTPGSFGSWSASGSNVGADGMLSTGCATFGGDDANDVWLRWTAPCNGQAQFELCGSDFDTVMTIFASCDDDLDAYIACNDDSTGTCAGALQSEIADFPATGGTEYYIRIAGWDNDEGSYTLNVTFKIPGDANGDLIVDLADLLAVISNWGSNGPAGDVTGDGAVNIDDLLAVISNWGSACL